MAKDNIEVELKFPVTKDVFEKVKELLNKVASFDKRVYQTDVYFTPSHRNFLAQQFPFEWLSLRKRGDKTILNYKHFYPEAQETHTHCDEFETLVSDFESFRKILSSLNFQELVVVEKEREVYNIKDEVEIAMDNVKELGLFIEIESLKSGQVEQIRKELFDIAKSLGITTESDKRGYPYLLMRSRGILK